MRPAPRHQRPSPFTGSTLCFCLRSSHWLLHLALLPAPHIPILRVRTQAEVSAKESAGSLLYTLLRPQSTAGGGECAGLNGGMVGVTGQAALMAEFQRCVRAVLMMVQPMYPPRLHFIGTLLLARLVAVLPSSVHEAQEKNRQHAGEVNPHARVAHTQAGGSEGGERNRMNQSVEGEEAEIEIEVGLVRRLLAMYHNLFAHPAIANVDAELG